MQQKRNTAVEKEEERDKQRRSALKIISQWLSIKLYANDYYSI